jgi:hypothetical protein
MRSASIADWILRRVAGKEQAASMVGDLMEISQHKGMMWFWFSVIGVVAARVWRPALGLVLAAYSGFWIVLRLSMELFAHHVKHRPPERWVPVSEVVLSVGGYLCVATVYSAIRFGVRDRFVQSAFAIEAVYVGLIYGWWQPVVLGCCIASFAGVVAISAMSGERRRAVLILPVVAATGYLSVYLAGFLLTIYSVLFHPEFPGWIGPRGYTGHFSLRYLFWTEFYLQQASQTLAIAAVCEIMRRWSMGNSKKGSALENGEALPGIS